MIALRAAGHDVSWIPESVPSTDDRNVLALAVAESRVLATLDKDFGEHAFREGLPATCGVILFSLPAIPSLIASIAARVLDGSADYTGSFIVVEESRLRERALPTRRA